jgi:cell division protease FtsH
MKKVEKKTSMKKQTAKRAALTGALAASLLVLPSVSGGTAALAQKAERDSQALSYGDLIRKVQSGEVARVELDETEQVARVYLKDQKPDTQPQQVRLLEQNPELINRLKERKVEFEEVSSANSRAAVSLLINLMWILPLVALMLLFLRRSTNASSQEFW